MFRKTVENPLNTDLVRTLTELQAEHRALMAQHLTLLNKLRETPLYSAISQDKLSYTEDQEDARFREGLVLAPPIPLITPENPFQDDRQDEAELRWASNLIGNAEVN